MTAALLVIIIRIKGFILSTRWWNTLIHFLCLYKFSKLWELVKHLQFKYSSLKPVFYPSSIISDMTASNSRKIRRNYGVSGQNHINLLSNTISVNLYLKTLSLLYGFQKNHICPFSDQNPWHCLTGLPVKAIFFYSCLTIRESIFFKGFSKEFHAVKTSSRS